MRRCAVVGCEADPDAAWSLCAEHLAQIEAEIEADAREAFASFSGALPEPGEWWWRPVILELENLTDRIAEVLRLAFVDAAIQDDNPDDPIVTTVVPSWADGDVVFLEGAFSIDTIARAVALTLQLNGDRDA